MSDGPQGYRDANRAMNIAKELARYSAAGGAQDSYQFTLGDNNYSINIVIEPSTPDKMYMILLPPGKTCGCCLGSGVA